ncbi:hypothetical protein L3i23_05730 [Herbiconiux sp. L3-i23]|nr:hypothetical protein L3i23_05730 [Herbiconiux sp. L3-i23]
MTTPTPVMATTITARERYTITVTTSGKPTTPGVRTTQDAVLTSAPSTPVTAPTGTPATRGTPDTRDTIRRSSDASSG